MLERTEGVNRPIGVFDSGIGGLTVVRELLRVLPHEDIIYFGDTARVPYGPKSPETVIRYSHEITSFLMSQDVKAVVVACNTATAHALASLQKTYNVPIIGVIEPGAIAASKLTRTKHVGVIGTNGLVNSHAYRDALHRLDSTIIVSEQACPLFVPFVEEGWLDHPATHLVAAEYLSPLVDDQIDTLVLGCTHYPLLKDVINDITGPSISLIDSAEETAVQTSALLSQHHLKRAERTDKPRLRFIASDSPQQFLNVGRRFLGSSIDSVETVGLGL